MNTLRLSERSDENIIKLPKVSNGSHWFCTPQRIEMLEREAIRWIGTPFYPNSNTCGPDGGVSCQKLVSEIYRTIGCCDVMVPEVSMAHARFSRKSLVEEFMAMCPQFNPISIQGLIPGDLLGFRIGRIVHHLGISMGRGYFIHVMEHCGTVIASLSDGTWSSRLALAWRPL